MHTLCVICSWLIGLVVLVDVAQDIHLSHIIVQFCRCFVDVDHMHIEEHTFIFTSLFVVDVVNGIFFVNLQFEYYIFELIGWVVLVDGHTPSTKASCWVFLNWVELGFTCSAVSNFHLLRTFSPLCFESVSKDYIDNRNIQEKISTPKCILTLSQKGI